MKKILLVAGAIAMLALSGCGIPLNINIQTVAGSGNVKSETRTVSGVREVNLSGAGELVIEQTGTESLTVETDDNVLPLITSEVKDGKLTIGFKPNTFPSRVSKLRYVLGVRSLEVIGLSGAGTIAAEGLSADALKVVSSGAGKITLAGTVGDLNLTLSGAGSFEGDKLAAQTVTVEISGLGGAVVNASKTLDASISGAGSVQYVGNPEVKQSITGAGSVKARNP